jgi:hypothetical protein
MDPQSVGQLIQRRSPASVPAVLLGLGRHSAEFDWMSLAIWTSPRWHGLSKGSVAETVLT